MGNTVYGAGNAGIQTAMTGTLTIKNQNDLRTRIGSMGSKSPTVKKRLNYNHREISGQLIRAKKAQSAATVQTRAKTRLSSLLRCAGTGQYDQRELANAIAHARRMVQCAKLKVNNLREEELEQRKHKSQNGSKDQQKQNEVKRRVAQKERELKSKVAIEQMQDASIEKRRRNEMMQKRRMHRSQERGKMNEADMKYIKAQMENDNCGSSYYNEDSGIALDISSTAAAMSELQMLEQQVQMEVEAQVEAEMALEMGSGTYSGSMGSTSATPGADASAASGAEASPIDVSV